MESSDRRQSITESRGARLSARRRQSQRQRKGALLGLLGFSILAVLLLALALFGGSSATGTTSPETPVITLDGIIDQASADYAIRVIDDAEQDGAPAVIIQIDSCGGRQDAARALIDKMTASPLPVIAWVGPASARSTSMGTLVFCAADIAAVAPGASLDTIIPEDVRLPRAKVDELAVLARSLSEQNGRSADWAELAVRQPLALDAGRAVSLGAADLEAVSQEELLSLVIGREARAKGIVIDTTGASPVPASMNLLERGRHFLLQPATAWVLLLVAGLAVLLALAQNGLRTLLPAAMLLLPAIYAAFTLPVEPAGAVLLLAGLALAATPVWFRSFGLLPVAGLAGILISPMLFFPSTSPWLRVPATITLLTGVGAVAALLLLARTRRSVRPSGRKAKAGVVGATGYAHTRLDPLGQVDIEDRIQSAECAGGETIEKGEEIQVVAASRHILKVRRL